MSQRLIRKQNNVIYDILSIGLSLYIAYINTRNLEYNRANAIASKNIAIGLREVNRELDILNRNWNNTKKGNDNNGELQ